MSNPLNILIGSGFYAAANEQSKLVFLDIWMRNTLQVSPRIAIVNNSAFELLGNYFTRCERNLGHACGQPANPIGRLYGWSVSWIIPALISYADGLDFVYKEQDCLAFGNWFPIVKQGRMAVGKNRDFPCEQSLFYIRNDAILEIVTAYLNIPDSDADRLPEHKFGLLMESQPEVMQFELPGGRNRPLPDSGPFYAQKITPAELIEFKRRGLI
jgi:hypothetical protein